MRRFRIYLVGLIATGLMAAIVSAFTYCGPHLTSQAPWINRIDVYNNDAASGSFNLKIWDSQGQLVSEQEYAVGANAVASVVLSADPGYVPASGEIVLPAVEGTCTVTTSSARVRPKLSFRYGDSLSLCEFFMQEKLAWEYVLPNTIQEHFIGTGLAVMNPGDSGLAVRLQAFLGGAKVGDTGQVEIAPHTKLVSISEGFWPGVGSDDFDMVRISSNQAAFPTPMSISWDQLNDRHVFFNAAPTALTQMPQAGDLVETDSIVGDLIYVPAGTFTQGSPFSEPCRDSDETQFTHVLTRNIAVMATEVTRQMWADLKLVQPVLLRDPTNTQYGSAMDNPVQNIKWYEAVLFANLLSLPQGFTRCYYTDAGFTTPIDVTNYRAGKYYCNFDANGYRLLTEGEWEYACRAGTATPLWIDEPNYTADNCDDPIVIPETWPQLETAAWFCANSNDPTGFNTSKPVGTKVPNRWGLYDVHGNVWEYCWDFHGTYPSGSITDHPGASSGSRRVLRGGCWYSTPGHSRSASRNYNYAHVSYPNIGFRLARSLP